MSGKNLESQLKLTYLAMIKNSVATKMFNSAFVKDVKTGKIFDVLNNGEFSCAFYVSGVLSLCSLMDKPHATVKTVTEGLGTDKNWKRIKENQLQPGDVIVWEKVTFEDGSVNEHIGFYLDENTAVSTDYKTKQVYSHHPTYGINKDGDPTRKIVKVYRSAML